MAISSNAWTPLPRNSPASARPSSLSEAWAEPRTDFQGVTQSSEIAKCFVRSLHMASARHIRCASIHIGLLVGTSKYIIDVAHRNLAHCSGSLHAHGANLNLGLQASGSFQKRSRRRVCVDLRCANDHGPSARIHVDEEACTRPLHASMLMSMRAQDRCTMQSGLLACMYNVRACTQHILCSHGLPMMRLLL